MKNRISAKCLILLAMAMVLVFSGSALAVYPTTDDPTPNLDRIVESGKLVVGTFDDYVPFQMLDTEGELMGYNVDIMKDMAEQLGVELVVKKPAFSILIPSLQKGDVDMIIAGMAISPKRALAVDFSIPYFYTGYCFLGNKKHEARFKAADDFNREGMVIGTMMGTPMVDLAKKMFPNAEIVEYKNLGVGFMAIVADKADVLLVDEALAFYFTMLRPDKTYLVEGKFTNDGHGIMIAHGQPDLLLWINTYLRDYMDSPQYREAYDKWFTDKSWWEDLTPEMKNM